MTYIRSEYNKVYRQRLIEQGLCTTCRKPRDGKALRCSACAKRAVEINRNAIQRARSAAKCAECKKPWSGNTLTCKTCLRAIRKAHAERLLITDGCTRCGKPRDKKHRACFDCRKQQRELSKARRKALVAEGRCSLCRTNQLAPEGKRCTLCVMKMHARRWLGSPERWPELQGLLALQNNRCAYSGEVLVVGGNASLDHKTPRSLGGENCIENLQWVTWQINRMKSNMTDDQFRSLCASLAEQKERCA